MPSNKPCSYLHAQHCCSISLFSKRIQPSSAACTALCADPVCLCADSILSTATASHAAAAKAAAAQAQAAAEGVIGERAQPDTCHAEQGAEYGGDDVIEWGTNNLKVSATFVSRCGAAGLEAGMPLTCDAQQHTAVPTSGTDRLQCLLAYLVQLPLPVKSTKSAKVHGVDRP
jgi:hypothetical protein